MLSRKLTITFTFFHENELRNGEGNGPRSRRDTLQRDCSPLIARSSKYCNKLFYRSVMKKKGNSWWRSTIYYYERVAEYKTVCCDGYGGSRCEPMCHGDSRINSCNRHEGRVIHIDGQVTTCSGGACTAPNTCSLCNTGYYADNRNGYCRACRAIDHCNIPRCTDGTRSVCARCDGEIKFSKPGYYAYTHHMDATKCLRACSWREGTRCFPGTCTGDMLYPSQCRCADGYGGSDCATFLPSALNKLKINSPEFVWTGDPHDPKLILPDPRYLDRKIWTNRIDLTKIAVDILASYDVPLISEEAIVKQTYLNLRASKIGIEKVEFHAVLRRGIDTATWFATHDCQFKAYCRLRMNETDIRTTPWNNILKGGFPTPFDHLDLVVVTINMKNGGIVYYTNREVDHEREHYYIKGATATKTLELQFDFYSPVHCMEHADPCTEQPLVTPDFTKQASFNVTWQGWSDKESGLEMFSFQVFPLHIIDATTDILTSDGSPVFETSADHIEEVATINLSKPGPYSLEMFVYDWAQNEKSTRRIFIFDDQSKVTLSGNAPFVKTADKKTNFTWINEQVDKIEVTWPGRFKNEMHWSNGWLNAVAALDHIPRKLDDTETNSRRTTSKIENIQGIVKFSLGYDISYDLKSTPRMVDFVKVPDDLFDKQMMIIKEELVDGKRLKFKIRGYDVMENFSEDTTTATIDLSPPVIINLWSNKEDIMNITVHGKEELLNLTFEWEVFDEHCGLHNISWKIFDNCSHTEEKIFVSQQEGTENLDECKQKYANALRGSSCYCTPFNGCFNRYFSLATSITISKNDNSLSDSLAGVYERGYFVEVTAVNSALLTSVNVIKVTLNTSTPVKRKVEEKNPGEKEMTETSFTRSSNEVQHVGTYAATVVNESNHSKPVCSDKLNIDASEAKMSSGGANITPNKNTGVKLLLTVSMFLMGEVRKQI